MPPCKECGWCEAGYSCDYTSKSSDCQLKLIALEDVIFDALNAVETEHRCDLDSAYDKIIEAIEKHFNVAFP